MAEKNGGGIIAAAKSRAAKSAGGRGPATGRKTGKRITGPER